ncbi:MAG TPA: Mur ligase family protein [bacterium]
MGDNRSIHFCGVCGVAMSQAAAWLKSQGERVSGSDEGAYPPISDFLKAQGIDIRTPYRAENLDGAGMAVIGNALSRGNPEVETILERRLPFTSLPELLHQRILALKYPIVVAGTHGKTTTTAALAQILISAGLSPGYLIGGLPVGWNSGFRAGEGQWFAIEGDEYDTAFFDKRPKFLHYQPQAVLLNNIEFDHADIYSNLGEIYIQFGRLIQLLPRNGCLAVNGDESNLDFLIQKAPCRAVSFGLNAKASVHAENVEMTPEGMQFRLRLADGQQTSCRSSLWGDHQLRNLIGAAAAAEFAGVAPDQIVKGIAAFRGVQRRLELKHHQNGLWIYDDFAHHPTAIRATLSSLRLRHPKAYLAAAFEPRSNTMVRNYFQREVGQALSLADRIVVGGIHRAEKIPAEQRLNVERIVQELRSDGREAHLYADVDRLADVLTKDLPKEAVIVLMSNGAFSGLCGKLLERL